MESSCEDGERMVQKLTSLEIRQRQIYLALGSFPIVISVLNAQGIQMSFWSCPLLKWIGIPCMGWGMTRSFYATARGDLVAATQFHLFGPVLFLACAIAAIHWATELYQGRRNTSSYVRWIQRPHLFQRLGIFSFLVILGYHVTRLILLYQSGYLQHWIQSSDIGNALQF